MDNYFTFSLAIAAFFYTSITWLGSHLSQDYKDNISLWLFGEYDSTWASKYCRAFDQVFGIRHFSIKCFIRSCLVSILSVSIFYIIFSNVMGLYDPSGRISDDLSFQKALFFGLFLNLIPDYISLFQTRYILYKFKEYNKLTAQTFILFLDFLFTALIAFCSIIIFQKFLGQKIPSLAELVGSYNIFLYFFIQPLLLLSQRGFSTFQV